MRMARYGEDVAGEVGGVVSESFAGFTRLPPLLDNAVDAVREEECGDSGEENDELDNATKNGEMLAMTIGSKRSYPDTIDYKDLQTG